MMKKVMTAGLLVLATAAHAVLQDVPGANYSIDPATGLQWLDVNVTANRSFNEVVRSPLFNEGWRYATDVEMRHLFTSNLGVELNEYSYNYAGAAAFMDTLGGPTGLFEAPRGIGGPFIAGLYIEASSGDRQEAFLLNNPSYTFHALGDTDQGDDSPWLPPGFGYIGTGGSFLVSPVPEPGTLLMMGAGLGLVVWAGKRRRGGKTR